MNSGIPTAVIECLVGLAVDTIQMTSVQSLRYPQIRGVLGSGLGCLRVQEHSLKVT